VRRRAPFSEYRDRELCALLYGDVEGEEETIAPKYLSQRPVSCSYSTRADRKKPGNRRAKSGKPRKIKYTLFSRKKRGDGDSRLASGLEMIKPKARGCTQWTDHRRSASRNQKRKTGRRTNTENERGTEPPELPTRRVGGEHEAKQNVCESPGHGPSKVSGGVQV